MQDQINVLQKVCTPPDDSSESENEEMMNEGAGHNEPVPAYKTQKELEHLKLQIVEKQHAFNQLVLAESPFN